MSVDTFQSTRKRGKDIIDTHCRVLQEKKKRELCNNYSSYQYHTSIPTAHYIINYHTRTVSIIINHIIAPSYDGSSSRRTLAHAFIRSLAGGDTFHCLSCTTIQVDQNPTKSTFYIPQNHLVILTPLFSSILGKHKYCTLAIVLIVQQLILVDNI